MPQSMDGVSAHYITMQVPMYIVIGAPLLLPQISNPSDDQVRKFLDLYIDAMESLCSRHKHDAGYGNTEFLVV